jgi:hypothetical protein
MKTSSLFNLDWNDIFKGLVVAVLTGSVLAILGTVSANNFDVFTANWVMIGHMFVNGAFSGFVGYLVKNFFTPTTVTPAT